MITARKGGGTHPGDALPLVHRDTAPPPLRVHAHIERHRHQKRNLMRLPFFSLPRPVSSSRPPPLLTRPPPPRELHRLPAAQRGVRARAHGVMVARVRRPARVGVRGGFEVRAGVPALYELFEARADASAREGASAVGVWYFEAVLLMGGKVGV